MIYDCFPFFNELELLDIRLAELYDVVDVFVLVESTHTFQKNPKPLFFAENKQRYQQYLPKIKHIVVDTMPGFFYKFRVPKIWDVHDFQKDQAILGLSDCSDDDVIVFSDVDEIPKAEFVEKYAKQPGIKVFEQRFYAYYLNNLCTFFDTKGQKCTAQYTENQIGFWRGSVMIDFSQLKQLKKSIKKMRLLRDRETDEHKVIKDSGWHFSSVGNIEKLQIKLKAHAHTEYNNEFYLDPLRLQEKITNGYSIFDDASRFRLMPVDHTFPAYLQNNQQRFSHLLAEIK